MLNVCLFKKIRRGLPFLILALGIGLSAWVASYVDRQITRDAENIFQQHVRDFEASLTRHFVNYDNILFGVAGMYQITDDVTPEQFRQYGGSLGIQKRFPALRSVNFAHYVDAAREHQSPASRRKDAEAVQLHAVRTNSAPPTDRSHLMVITRVYPLNSPGLGVDIFSNIQKHADDRSINSALLDAYQYRPNKVVSSGLPAHRPGQGLSGLAARLGIFKPDVGGQSRLIGTAGIGFDLKDFFAEAVPFSLVNRLQFQMVNVGRTNGRLLSRPILVFDSTNARIGGPAADFVTDGRLTASFDLGFGGALLRTTVSEARSDLVSARDQALPYYVFIAGALLFGLLAILSCRLLGQNAFLQNTVKKKNADLQLELQQKRSLERQLAHSTAEERRRIGRELHDDLGQRLTGVSLSAEALAAQLQEVAPQLAGHADAIEQETSHAISSIRALAHGLMPVPSGAEGLREALADLVRDVSALTNIPCTFDYDDPVAIEDEDIAVNLYRIVQEALNNAIRHGKASKVAIHLDYVDEKVVLSIADNGIGFAPDEVDDGGAGLRIMKHRASVSGYQLSIESSAKHGTTIKVSEC